MVEKPDIAAVLEHYGATNLPHRHNWTAIRCPFHEDRSASASFSREAGSFKCFACDIKGDGYSIIMNQEGYDFPSALRFAEELSGRSLRDVLPESQGRTRRNRLSEEPGNVRGQRTIVQARRRRRPIAGT